MTIVPLVSAWQVRVEDLIKESWAGPLVVTCGEVIDTRGLPGFIALEADDLLGYALYRVEDNAVQLVVLESLVEGKGAGGGLVKAIVAEARELGKRRLYLVTTNDNAHAIRFYQRQGMDWSGFRPNALAEARRIKPGIPLIGMDGIPIKHELEFEWVLNER